MEPSSGAVARPKKKWLPPLPPFHGSPVIGKGNSVVVVVFLVLFGGLNGLLCLDFRLA